MENHSSESKMVLVVQNAELASSLKDSLVNMSKYQNDLLLH